MTYLLDTDICVYWLKGNRNIEEKAMHVGLDNIHLSFITISELYYGAYKSQRVNENVNVVKRLEELLEVIHSDVEICSSFGTLKASLEKEGKIIDDADLFIASCALARGAILVTNNERHFRRIKGLKIENWSGK
jgi:predicted nucleic acid-binding protein